MPLRLDMAPGNVSFASIGGTNIMAVPRDIAIALMRKYTVTYGAFEDDALGIYTIQSVGNQGEVSFMSFTPPKHVFQPRLNACAWNPKGKIGAKQTKLTLDPIEYDGEQCPDALYGSCWERIFGVGTDINKLMGTPEGRALADEILRLVYTSLGNSYHDMVQFGGHPLIDDADANGWFTVDATEWNDFKGQQDSTTGHITLVDALKADGLDHFNLDISSFYNSTTGAFTGDAIDLMDAVIAARTRAFRVAENQPAGMIKGIIRVDEVTFEAFVNQLLLSYNQIPDVYKLHINGEGDGMRLTNAMKYKGYAIVPETSWGVFDEITGTKTRRVIMSFPGVFGIAHDVSALGQYGGMGLIVQESPLIRDKGRLDMYTAMKTGQLILDTDFVVNGSLTLIPS